jgi:hypothetical protein
MVKLLVVDSARPVHIPPAELNGTRADKLQQLDDVLSRLYALRRRLAGHVGPRAQGEGSRRDWHAAADDARGADVTTLAPRQVLEHPVTLE